ncbi:hypothetical protein ACQP00_24910 [Dactylosporangium sp. CS-047395]|uniref:hypothetical protein n=1 Tax=Dactylosporangium sp. CS-047395 TaxID=3239936 RepID=UPI003D8FB208
MFKRRVLSVRASLAVLALGWLVAGVALIAQRQAEAQLRRAEQAPVCAPDQVFAGDACRAGLDGTVTALSTRAAEVDAGGRHLTFAVSLHRIDISAPGTPVQVTVYRGVPIRIDGDRIHVDAEDSPADRVDDAREFVRAAIYLGTVLGGLNLIISLATRWLRRRRPAAR